MDVRLVAISPKGTRKSFALQTEITVLGRQEGCTLHIPLSEISRRHCQFILDPDRVLVKDLDSANGTFVNGAKVAEKELQAGDIVSLAETVKLLIQIDGEPSEIDEAKLATKRAPRPAKQEAKKPSAAEPASPFVATTAGATDQDAAEEILGESFFLDLEEEDEE